MKLLVNSFLYSQPSLRSECSVPDGVRNAACVEVGGDGGEEEREQRGLAAHPHAGLARPVLRLNLIVLYISLYFRDKDCKQVNRQERRSIRARWDPSRPRHTVCV